MGQKGESDAAPLISQAPMYAVVYPSGYTTTPNITYHNGQLVYTSSSMLSCPPISPQNVSTPPNPDLIPQKGPWNSYATAAFVLYILSTFGIWICALPSIIISLRLVNKKVIPFDQRATVIACSILELIGWAFLPTFVWYQEKVCDHTHDCHICCVSIWWGWISILVWWMITIGFGVPRAIYTYGAKNNFPDSY